MSFCLRPLGLNRKFCTVACGIFRIEPANATARQCKCIHPNVQIASGIVNSFIWPGNRGHCEVQWMQAGIADFYVYIFVF